MNRILFLLRTLVHDSPFFAQILSRAPRTAELQKPKTEKDLPRTVQLEDKVDLICTKIVQRT